MLVIPLIKILNDNITIYFIGIYFFHVWRLVNF